MNILGLHFGHDGSCCIVKDNKLCVAISNERLSKKKKEYGVTMEMIEYCLNEAQLSIEDINYVGITDYFKKFSDKGIRLLGANGIEITGHNQLIFGNSILETLFEINGKQIKCYIIPHHLAHHCAAYYTSPFEDSFGFSMDACGQPLWNSLVSFGKGNEIMSIYCPNIMSGEIYNNFTDKLLIGNPLHKAGSTMGLACYGNILKDFYGQNNYFKWLDFFFAKDNENYENKKNNLWSSITGLDKYNSISLNEKYNQRSMDIAATMQYLFEESVLHVIKNLDDRKFKSDNICLSGGSFLNCNLNSRIKNETRFKNIHLFPACGDDGLCVGVSLFINHLILKNPRYKYEPKDLCYLGSSQESSVFDHKYIAEKISEGKIVGLFQGRSEYGPRALGNRSILADPRNYHNREKINFLIKKREWFRPFAPSVLEEESEKWFDFSGPSPYMLFTAKVKNPKEVPAITHFDNSSRMQTVNEKLNPIFYDIIKNFYEITGIPMVLNTSLNGDGQPVLESEHDAKDFFRNSSIDIMVINGKILEKKDV